MPTKPSIEARIGPLVTISTKVKFLMQQSSRVSDWIFKCTTNWRFLKITLQSPRKPENGYIKVFSEGFIRRLSAGNHVQNQEKITDVLYNVSIYRMNR